MFEIKKIKALYKDSKDWSRYHETIVLEKQMKCPDITVHLTLFNATIAEGALQKNEHNDIKWITVSEIDDHDFCPADTEILKKLVEVD